MQLKWKTNEKVRGAINKNASTSIKIAFRDFQIIFSSFIFSQQP
jgi:hypothetical protein